MTDLMRNRALHARAALLCALAIAVATGCNNKDDGNSENETGDNPPNESGDRDSGSSGEDGASGSDGRSGDDDGDDGSGGTRAMDAGNVLAPEDSGSGPAPEEDSGLGPEGGRMGPDGAVQVRAKPDTGCERLEWNESKYWYCVDALPPSLASGACWAAGGTLVVIDDADEDIWIVSQLFEEHDAITIGYSDSATEGTWAWADGTTNGYENWDRDQPGLDDFAFLKRENGMWFTSTDAPYPYICEDWKQ